MVDVPADFAVLLNSAPPISRIESNKMHWLRKRQQTNATALQRGIDQIGQLAAESRSLKRPVTSFARFADSPDEQALYLLWEPLTSDQPTANGGPSSRIYGYLKVVRDRRLYLVDGEGRQFVTTPLCVLDFFIHQSVQHQGKGAQLFRAMLKAEGDLGAHRCAFDKPSDEFLHFLARHFSLERPLWQPNSFVVFPSFFEGIKPEKVSSAADDRLRPMTALERHRRSVNEQYNGQPPMSSRLSPLPAAQRDQAGALIHQQQTDNADGRRTTPVAPDTPQGRKVQRDYGHQRIW
ncbi:hypothetical protein niasHS_006242 [Heterodera schachtii]|uniref:Alpha-tubulin N-acetyltransferase n=2 Tax=Heterodera TaxID=34509 RepID=A0ABD2JSR9_HETSC